MLIGEYRHTIDAKKRIAIPVKFRKELGARAVLTRGLDACLFLYPLSVWETIAAKLGELPMGQAGTRGFVRLLLSGAHEVDLDKLGRILVPEHLRTAAGLEKQVVLTGVFNRVEIWDAKAWDAYRAKSEANAAENAERLGEIGAF